LTYEDVETARVSTYKDYGEDVETAGVSTYEDGEENG
jgi:hypothetical protein